MLETILRENWEHSRHCENQILWFTNIYAVVVAALLVFIGNAIYAKPPDYYSAILFTFFGFILSVIGFLIVIALSLGHQNYIANIVVILVHWNKQRFYKDWEKPLHYKEVHRRFFEIAIALFLMLLLFCTSQDKISFTSIRKVVLLIAIGLVIARLCRFIFKKEFQDGKKVLIRICKILIVPLAIILLFVVSSLWLLYLVLLFVIFLGIEELHGAIFGKEFNNRKEFIEKIHPKYYQKITEETEIPETL